MLTSDRPDGRAPTAGTAPRGATPSVIGPDARFEGLLSFSGEAVVEGAHRGDVIATGLLRIAEGGSVVGRIEVDQLIVAGTVEGEVEAPGRVVLESTARVRGRIRTRRLAIEEGGVLEGRCQTLSATSVSPDSENRAAASATGGGASSTGRDESGKGNATAKVPLQPSVAAAPSP